MDPLENLTTNSGLYWARLENSSRCCEADTASIEPVRIVDIPVTRLQSNENIPLRRQECVNLKILDEYLGDPNDIDYTSRLISICQNDSWSRLQITKSMLRKLVEHHGIDADFLEVPLSFFYRTTDEEQSFSVPWTVKDDGHSIQSFYTFRYAEFKGLVNEPWVIRQAGVYHKYDVQDNTSLYVLLNAVPNSAAYRRVLECFSSHQAQMKSSPLWLHCVIHASYFMNWRDYIDEYEKRLLPIVSAKERTCVTKTVHQKISSRLANVKRSCRTFMRTGIFLQQRSNCTAVLLADTLAFRNQGVAQEQNGSMVILTRSAVFITVITLIYLPWTLVTGIFGMEFFEMDQVTKSLMTSPQIWIYFVTAVGATVLTMALYYVMAGFPKIRREKETAETSEQSSHVPTSLQRGYTDIEKNLKGVQK
ncbi:hypothetical protein EK21DRAFT_102554 [Setomelanomma holmii]|uniref:CorA-like transporter domain-containing protein n=1 Tax=Setomelanomma holmii TaxID=210430 RepID=A0A9P4H4R4_9PLEO|nr:hypothetical protein EK21DRAFT_102554 [Setomelanomma holmii]